MLRTGLESGATNSLLLNSSIAERTVKLRVERNGIEALFPLNHTGGGSFEPYYRIGASRTTSRRFDNISNRGSERLMERSLPLSFPRTQHARWPLTSTVTVSDINASPY